MFNTKSFESNHSASHNLKGSRTFLVVAAVIALGQVFIVQVADKVFNVEPMSWSTWLWIVASTSLVMWVGQAWQRLNILKGKMQKKQNNAL